MTELLGVHSLGFHRLSDCRRFATLGRVDWEAGVIALLLSKPYRMAESHLVAYLRRYLAEHHKSCADWVSEISEPMFRQLILDGIGRTLATCFFVLALVFVPFAIRSSEENLARAIIWVVSGSVFLLFIWRTLATQCVDREFRYRRQHNKWRWER